MYLSVHAAHLSSGLPTLEIRRRLEDGAREALACGWKWLGDMELLEWGVLSTFRCPEGLTWKHLTPFHDLPLKEGFVPWLRQLPSDTRIMLYDGADEYSVFMYDDEVDFQFARRGDLDICTYSRKEGYQDKWYPSQVTPDTLDLLDQRIGQKTAKRSGVPYM